MGVYRIYEQFKNSSFGSVTQFHLAIDPWTKRGRRSVLEDEENTRDRIVITIKTRLQEESSEFCEACSKIAIICTSRLPLRFSKAGRDLRTSTLGMSLKSRLQKSNGGVYYALARSG